MTGMEPFVDPLAGGLVGILIETAKKVGGGFAQALGDRAKVTTASKKYADRYTVRYGEVRLLGMKQGISLESIYTKVKFLDELSIRKFTSLTALEQAYRESQKRRFQTQQSLPEPESFTLINESPYLMVLGGPGAGKSTFLRRIGLEALKGEKGNLKHRCIPVMLELKRFNSTDIDLTRAISDELTNFGFPGTEEFTLNLLEQGKLLILLDGLDEVPKANQNAVIGVIQNFVTRYDCNRYIASCRIAAHRSIWNHFLDVEIADFANDQIQQFIRNWFQSGRDQEVGTAEKCWETLNDPSNASAKELAQTPLLLTFLCMVYDRTQGLPTNRATLYRKALDILLEEWAAEKRVYRETIYGELNPDLEKVLLSEIAFNGFINDQLFFTQQELIDQIRAFLFDTVDKPKYLDSRAVLDAIAIQQGILVERAEDIFSFSHLTLQEYLTTQYISQDSNLVKELVEQHVTNQRWCEVFLLVAGLLRSADNLLALIAEQLPTFLYIPKLRALFNWANSVTVTSEDICTPAAKQVAAIYLTRNLAFSNDQIREPQKVIAHNLNFAQTFEGMKVFKPVNFKRLIARLEDLKKEALQYSQSDELSHAFANQVRRAWFDTLNLYPEWVDLSKPELEAIQDYLYTCELMTHCQKSAVRVSETAWKEIEERMLTIVVD